MWFVFYSWTNHHPNTRHCLELVKIWVMLLIIDHTNVLDQFLLYTKYFVNHYNVFCQQRFLVDANCDHINFCLKWDSNWVFEWQSTWIRLQCSKPLCHHSRFWLAIITQQFQKVYMKSEKNFPFKFCRSKIPRIQQMMGLEVLHHLWRQFSTLFFQLHQIHRVIFFNLWLVKGKAGKYLSGGRRELRGGKTLYFSFFLS